MYPPLVRDKLLRRKPLLSENRSHCVGPRVKREFIRRESPLTERDGYFTDENTDDNPNTPPGSPHRQLLRLIASLFRVDPSVDLDTKLFPTALNIRSILGESRFDGVPERLTSFGDTGENKKLAAVKEGKWLLCAIIFYQALDYLQKHKANGHNLNFEDNDQTYIFDPEDLNALIRNCLSEGNEKVKMSTPISDAFLKSVSKQWRTGRRLSSLIARE